MGTPALEDAVKMVENTGIGRKDQARQGRRAGQP
jgi:hypothetical protein